MRRKTTTWPAAGTIAGLVIYMATAAPALAMQLLDAADHAELEAEISAAGVSRIALEGDRIRRVIRSPGGFEAEHDAETGDLYLRANSFAAPAAGAEGPDREPATVFLGTEKGFTYRLTLTPKGRDSAQILIRNRAVSAEAAVHASGADPRVAGLVRIIRSVARREPLAGYAIGTGNAIGGLPVIETWRGPRFSAHVVESGGVGTPRTSPGPWASGPPPCGCRRPGAGPRAGASR